MITAKEALERTERTKAKFQEFCKEHRDEILDNFEEVVREASRRGHTEVEYADFCRDWVEVFYVTTIDPPRKDGSDRGVVMSDEFKYYFHRDGLTQDFVIESLFGRAYLQDLGYAVRERERPTATSKSVRLNPPLAISWAPEGGAIC